MDSVFTAVTVVIIMVVVSIVMVVIMRSGDTIGLQRFTGKRLRRQRYPRQIGDAVQFPSE